MRTLKKQLLLLNIVTTGAAVLVSLALMFSMEMRSWKQALVQDMTIKADIIGNQCTAALTFSSPKDGEEILGALWADEQIVSAAVYARDGKLFVSYLRPGGRANDPGPAPAIGCVFGSDHLVLTRPIVLDRERVGTISIRVGLERLRAVLFKYVAVSVVVLVLALLTAWMLLSRLQQTVTAPVTGLARLMEGVSRDKDYSRRAGENGPAELISLSRSFNEMLAAIQSRDRDLEHSLTELQEAYGKLQDLDRLKSDFISTISHEFRTPITSIKAFVGILSMKPNLTEEQKKRILDTVNDESDRLARLISDLLDLSRIESGAMQWRDQDVDMNEVTRTVISGILPLAQSKDISIEERTENGLPLIPADRDRLMQVVVNLLSNAIKFTPAGGKIIVETHRQGSPAGVTVSIADTGPGIPAEDLSRIFDKFHRTTSAQTNAVEGTGIGLTISRSIVEHYGGRIWATSEGKKGSIFTFFLPVDPRTLPDSSRSEG